MKIRNFWQVFLVVMLISWTSCKKTLTVHLIPYSHNHEAWKDTFEDTYEKETKDILTNVLEVLMLDQSKIFHWGDLMFLMRWWKDQDEETRNDMEQLIRDNRFILVHGGWVINDEALPTYKEALLQMRYGLDIVKNVFDKKPTIGWQISSYGGSSVTVANLHKLGYDVLVENRISDEYKKKLRAGDGYSFQWEGHQVSKDKSDSNLFCYMIQYSYEIHKMLRDDNFSLSYNSNLFYYNIMPVIDELNKLSDNKINDYHVMVLLQGDFTFRKAGKNFKQLDDFIPYLNKQGESKGYETVTKYSNIYEYFEILKTIDVEHGKFKGDFLPYIQPIKNETKVYTGYYSNGHSRVRSIFHDLQSTKILFATRAIQKNKGSLDFNGDIISHIEQIDSSINEATQHLSFLLNTHGITGTHTHRAENDYIKRYEAVSSSLSDARSLIVRELSTPLKPETISEMKDIISELEDVDVYRYNFVNPSGYERNEIVNITLPVGTKRYEKMAIIVQDSTESKIHKDVLGYIISMYPHPPSNNTREEGKGFFKISIPALGDIQIYLLHFSDEDDDKCRKTGIK